MAPKLPYLFRPYFLAELPGWGVIYHKLGIHGKDNVDPRWRDAPTKVIRGKHHGYRMRLRLNDDIDRDTYFLGRYYDLEIQLLLNELLSPGDTFLDIGANVGRTTLHGASRVGETGSVIAIEPQPECCARIEEAIADNGLSHVVVHNLAAGEHEEELELKILGGGTIMASLAIDEDVDRADVREVITVPVVPLDTIVPDEFPGTLSIKIDVEGFEVYALRGLEKTLATHQPVVITEVVHHQLARADSSTRELFDFFGDKGYAPYEIGLTTTTLRRSLLRLTPLAGPDDIDFEADVCWVPKSGTFDPSPWV